MNIDPVLLPAWSKEKKSYSWFNNSFRAAGCITNYTDCLAEVYRETYGYKIHQYDDLDKPACVEFPNESEAIMFMLKWA